MIKYVGDGAYFQGIPARDLTDEEFAALPAEQQQILLDSGLYAPAETAEAPEAPATRSSRRRTAEPEASATGG
jgi:hypothetical protein